MSTVSEVGNGKMVANNAGHCLIDRLTVGKVVPFPVNAFGRFSLAGALPTHYSKSAPTYLKNSNLPESHNLSLLLPVF